MLNCLYINTVLYIAIVIITNLLVSTVAKNLHARRYSNSPVYTCYLGQRRPKNYQILSAIFMGLSLTPITSIWSAW